MPNGMMIWIIFCSKHVNIKRLLHYQIDIHNFSFFDTCVIEFIDMTE